MASRPSNIRLAPPGAGLPRIERFVGGLLLKFAVLRYDAGKTDALLTTESRTALKLAASCAESDRSRPVLIKRIAGIEDSSRNWSVHMTLDHMRIVNDLVCETIDGLARGAPPNRVARIEDVKPSPDAGPETFANLEVSVENFRAVVAGIPSPYPAETFSHPWFGPLGIAGWHSLAAMHMQIHRKQVEKILKGLARARE